MANQTMWPFGNVLPNSWYWAGNEPDILTPWQFVYAGNNQAWRTQVSYAFVFRYRLLLYISCSIGPDGCWKRITQHTVTEFQVRPYILCT
jgi:hypothetical protein